MFPSWFEVSIILLLILINGLLAMTEMAVVSSRRARLQQKINEGDERARLALDLSENPGDFLSTVQIGITMVGILAGAFGGAALAQTLSGLLSQVEFLAPFSGTLAFILVVVLITYLNLILGELVPKRLALNNPERVATSMAGPMKTISWLARPIVILLSLSTNLVLRLLGIRQTNEPPVTEEEVKVMIEQGTQAGVFEEAEQDMLRGVFRLGDLRVENLITPRTEIDYLDLDSSPEEHLQKLLDSGRSRFPVARDGLDNVQGVVQAKDLLAAYLKSEEVRLEDHLREPLFVPQSMPALKVLELIRDSRLPMALVIDEYGGLQGLVTVNDILEAVVGDISVRSEMDEPEIVRREDGSFLLDGMLTMDEVQELLEVANFPGLKQGYYQTLGGFVMTYLGRIPIPADYFEWGGIRFEVVDMDGLRVDKILVVPTNEKTSEPDQENGV
jgi:putative hemolysin